MCFQTTPSTPPPDLSDTSDSDSSDSPECLDSPPTPIDSSTPQPVSIVESDVSYTSQTLPTVAGTTAETPTNTPPTPVSSITSPAPAYPVYLWAVKSSSYPGIFDNFQVALGHASCRKDVHKFESREDAEDYMKDSMFKTYYTSENSYVSFTGERIYKVYTDGSHTAEKRKLCEDGSFHCELGYSGYGVWFGENHPDNVAAKSEGGIQCSQQAELQALVEAYRIISERQDGRTYEIYCDCPTAIDLVKMSCLTYCRFRPTVERIRKYRKRSNSTICLLRVLGHNGDVGNEHAHYLANMGRKGNYSQHSYPCVNGALRYTMSLGTYGLRARYIYDQN